jgi:phenolic acid decarboxylase
MKYAVHLFSSVCLFILSGGVHSQEVQAHALADVELSYTYSDGGAVTLTLSDGKLGYLWTAGPFEGTEVRGLDYYSRELAESIYFVSWHDPENKNFVTLIFDLDRMIEHGTALIGYETDTETTLFDEARIGGVKRL